MTAEGDNAVLMQKVAKELLGVVQSGEKSLYDPTSFKSSNSSLQVDLDLLFHWLCTKETILVSMLAEKLQNGMANGKDLFSIWMYEESDLIQNVARAYGECVVFKQCLHVLETCNSSLRDVLQITFSVYGASLIERDLGWYLTENIISVEQGKAAKNLLVESCNTMSNYAVDLVKSFQVPLHVCQIPILTDWVKYNETDNQGEIKNYSSLFKQ